MKYDLLVIGAGSGGLSTAKTAAGYGAKVAIAEPVAIGGTCVNRGCVPKKLMVNAADFVQHQRVAQSHHWQNLNGHFDWAGFKEAMYGHLQDIQASLKQSLKAAGVDIMPASAQFIDANQVSVGEQMIAAEHIVIAVGGKPIVPDMPGKELVLTSNDMFHLSHLPKQLTIVGGGYIGVEFSHIFALLGTQVTLIDTSSCLLSGFDEELRRAAQAGLESVGVRVILEASCTGIQKQGDRKEICLSGQHSESLMADTILMAIGRTPNLESLRLDAAGVSVDGGKIAVDKHGQTSQPHIYAVGDCVERLPLTPVAVAEGEAVAKTIFQQPTSVDYRWIPSAVFGIPQLASAGWTEETARARFKNDVDVVRREFTPLRDALMKDPQRILMKWVLRQSSGEVLGVHIVGNEAPEVIQGLLPALRQGLTEKELTSTVGIHPTSAEELFDVPNG